jgi:hypothetical protein
MKEIKLTQGFVTQVDDEDFERLNQFRWCIQKTKTNYYAARYSKAGGAYLYMHRIIMNTPSHLEIDHIDHNGLNNQKINLRNCTRSQNLMNRTPCGKSNYLGVSYAKKKKLFEVHLTINHKDVRIGYFKTEIEAALARDKAAKEYHGEFANLNFK